MLCTRAQLWRGFYTFPCALCSCTPAQLSGDVAQRYCTQPSLHRYLNTGTLISFVWNIKDYPRCAMSIIGIRIWEWDNVLMNHCYSGSLLGKLSLPPKIISKCVPMSHTIPATYLLHTQAVPFLKRSGRSCRALPWCRERAWMDVEGAPQGRRSRVGGGWRRRWGGGGGGGGASKSSNVILQLLLHHSTVPRGGLG